MNLVGRTPRHQEAGQERFMSFIDYLMELMEARRIVLTLGESLGYVSIVALRIYL